MEQHLNESDSIKVEIVELESLLGLKNFEVCEQEGWPARKVRVSTWLPAECDGTSVKGCW